MRVNLTQKFVMQYLSIILAYGHKFPVDVIERLRNATLALLEAM